MGSANRLYRGLQSMYLTVGGKRRKRKHAARCIGPRVTLLDLVPSSSEVIGHGKIIIVKEITPAGEVEIAIAIVIVRIVIIKGGREIETIILRVFIIGGYIVRAILWIIIEVKIDFKRIILGWIIRKPQVLNLVGASFPQVPVQANVEASAQVKWLEMRTAIENGFQPHVRHRISNKLQVAQFWHVFSDGNCLFIELRLLIGIYVCKSVGFAI